MFWKIYVRIVRFIRYFLNMFNFINHYNIFIIRRCIGLIITITFLRF